MISPKQRDEWLQEAKEIAEATFAIFDLFDLANKTTVIFNSRFTSKAGDANYTRCQIRLSTPLWERMTPQKRYETVVHEVCHIVTFHISKLHHRQVTAHGWEWKCAMMKCSVHPERCHNIDTTGLTKKRPRFSAFCDCGIDHQITKVKVDKIKRGLVFVCRRCRSKLRLGQPTKEVQILDIAACNK